MAAAPIEPFNEVLSCRYGQMVVHRHDRVIGRSLRAYGEWCESEVRLLSSFLQPGDTVIDAGANVGTHTLPFAKLVGENGRVLAFEPQRLTHQALCANLAFNSLANVTAYLAALGREPGTVLVPELDRQSVQNFGGVELGAYELGEAVPVMTVDGLNLPNLRLLKADVEGMESQLLDGALATIDRCRPILFVEDDRPQHSPSLRLLLQGLGYRLYRHVSPYHNPANLKAHPIDEFPGHMSINLLCLPAESVIPPPATCGYDNLAPIG